MSLWKSCLLQAYYYGSYPYRWWRNLCAAAEHRLPVVVLFYHRIADHGVNSWTTSNRSFARQIRWLQDHFDLVPLSEAQRRIRACDNDRPCVSITFDDGYADNCREAIPLLVRERIPCTYFVTLKHVLTGEPFPHDAERGDAFPPNNVEQLQAMAAAGIEIGAHGRTHADMAKITDLVQLYDEVVTAGEELAELIGRPVRYLAFPFGGYLNLTSRAFEMAYDGGYDGVCSAYGGYNLPGDDAFHLQRIHVDEGLIRLKNRATIDPRKINTARFEYRLPQRLRQGAVRR